VLAGGNQQLFGLSLTHHPPTGGVQGAWLILGTLLPFKKVLDVLDKHLIRVAVLLDDSDEDEGVVLLDRTAAVVEEELIQGRCIDVSVGKEVYLSKPALQVSLSQRLS
jgi:hypothetical protein